MFGIGETLERRRGGQIKARGIYRDAVRSSGSHFVRASGLRWVSLMWLANITLGPPDLGFAFSDCPGALGRVLSEAGTPAEAGTTAQEAYRLARQIILQLRRWLPHRSLALVADRSCAVLDLLHFCQSLAEPVTRITRLRLDR